MLERLGIANAKSAYRKNLGQTGKRILKLLLIEDDREASRTTPGYRRGLSLPAAIADLHGTEAEMESVDRGLAVCVTFKRGDPEYQ